jgi:acylphosphatase
VKLKIIITGPKVHEVGYSPWLTDLAIDMFLRGFEVYNDEVDGQQAVIALAEADDQRIKRFYNLVRTKQPLLANVNSVTSEDYSGDIVSVWQAAAMNTSKQLNKAVPILLEMRGDLKAVKANTEVIMENTKPIPQIHEEIKGPREDIQPGFAMQFR